MTDLAIELDSLTKRFGSRTAVSGVSLQVPKGAVYGLVGPNGAGKTTLMRAMLGFTGASSGTSKIFGQTMPASHNSIYPRIGVIIEEPHFYEFMSGRANLQQVVAAHAMPITRAQVDQALAEVDLTDRANDRVKTYSLGMRQRLGIARALLHDPELLILDEPSNGLDPPGIRDMRVLLRSIADGGRTVFVSSHILAEIELLCDHVAVLKDGVIIADGTVDQLVGDSPTGGGGRFVVGVADVAAARVVMEGREDVAGVVEGDDPGTLLVSLADGVDPNAIADVNARLVEAGVAVHRLQPVARSLEQRFLEIVDGDA